MNRKIYYQFQTIIKRISPSALVLLYHRSSSPTIDPQLLNVTSSHFAEHMEILHRSYNPCSLHNLLRQKTFGNWKPKTVVVTFDDGYADNFQIARPILENFNVPATFFVVSGKIDDDQEYWWDTLERIFLLSSNLPNTLNLRIGQHTYFWTLVSSTDTSKKTWDVLKNEKPTPYQQVYLDLMKILRELNVDFRESVLAELSNWAGVDINRGRQENRSVAANELRKLHNIGIIEIGSHTVNHPSLSSLSLVEQKKEIIDSKSRLETLIGYPVKSFSYPYGERRDYTRDTIKLVREAGYSCACSNFSGTFTILSDPYQIPRFIVRDWDGETFARKLEEWFHE
jgi:peptidoglycan/xylan/chitin deacetylase (PgdA/CDA1 family)